MFELKVDRYLCASQGIRMKKKKRNGKKIDVFIKPLLGLHFFFVT